MAIGRTIRRLGAATAVVVALSACDDAVPLGDLEPATRVDPVTPSGSAASLRVDMTWNWQLQGDIDTTVDADVYDIDLFDVSSDVIAGLQADGRIVICYFSSAFEDWRADADEWPDEVLGEPLDDWEGERWADIRSEAVRDVLTARLDLAVEKGCDGVEPDNVTAFQNSSGFDLTADDQLDFNRFLASASAERRLLAGLKNDLEQIPDLVDDFDFAVNEQCLEFDECGAYGPFVAAGKPVFGAEYSDEARADLDAACDAVPDGLSVLVLSLDLDGSFRHECPV